MGCLIGPYTAPDKCTLMLIFQLIVMYHKKKNHFPPFFPPKNLLHQVGAEGQQLEAREAAEAIGRLATQPRALQPPPAPASPPSMAHSKKRGERRSRLGHGRCRLQPTTSTGFVTRLHRSFLFPFLYYSWKSRVRPGCC